MKNVKYGIN